MFSHPFFLAQHALSIPLHLAAFWSLWLSVPIATVFVQAEAHCLLSGFFLKALATFEVDGVVAIIPFPSDEESEPKEGLVQGHSW